MYDCISCVKHKPLRPPLRAEYTLRNRIHVLVAAEDLVWPPLDDLPPEVVDALAQVSGFGIGAQCRHLALVVTTHAPVPP